MDIAVSTHQAPMQVGVLRLHQLVRVLRRHMVLILFCGVLAAVAAYAVARTAPKVYTANAALTVEGDRFAIPELQGVLRNDAGADPMPWVRTEVQALTSRALVGPVAAKLHLEQDPEFNPALRPPSALQQLRERIAAAVTPVLPTGPADAPAPGPDEGVLSSVNKALAVFQDNRSLVISVAFTSQDPRRASEFINTLLADYVQSRAGRRVAASQGANEAIAERIDQVRADLVAIEDKMRDLRNKGEVVSVRAGGVSQQQVEELTTAAARATLERSQLEINYERATAAVRSGSSDALASVLNSPTISRFRDQEGAASRRMAELSTRYGPNYPGVRSAAAELGSARKQLSEEATRIVASLGAQLRVARGQETDVQRQLEEARRTGVQAENARAELEQLQQEATTRRALYQTMLQRAQQTAAQPTGTETPDVRVLTPAVPPGAPSGPNTKLTALMGGAGGTLLGCLLALLRVRGANGFETASEVTDATGLPVLAALPRKLLRPGRGLLAQAPRTDGPDAEAMRLLRDRLRYAGRSGAPRSVVFVPVKNSPLAARAAASFARAVAASGENALLVEGNLRRPGLAALLGRAPGGLARLLGGEDWQDAIVPDQPGLGVLLAGPKPADGPNPLASVHLQNFLVEARQEHDLVVLDSPQSTSSDASVLVQRADVAVLLIDGRTGQAAVMDAAVRLGSVSRTPLVGMLVTRA